MRIIAVASGKGGVGKSLVAANVAIALAQMKKHVVLADLDFGGSNLHLVLGEQIGIKGIGTFLNNSRTKLEEIIYTTSWKEMHFIPGESELPGVANTTMQAKKRLIRALTGLKADYLILDLGAGTHFNTIDFFLLSGCGILVTTPTLTSTLNAYLFLKNAVFRILTGCYTRNSPVSSYMDNLRKDGISLQRIHLTVLMDSIRKMDPNVFDLYRDKISHLRPRLIMNMMDNPKDVSKSSRLRISTREYLGIEMESLGIIYRDQLQNVAQRSGLPIIAYKPQSVLAQAIFRIADNILEIEEEISEPLTNLEAENSFKEAELVAGADFQSKVLSLEELLHSGALSQGDLVETLRTQQMEIQALKKENRFLKSKIVEASNQGFRV